MESRRRHDIAVAAALDGHFELAVQTLREHLREQPNDRLAARNLGLILLSEGRYREGAPLYEARLDVSRAPVPQLPFPRWNAEPIDGKRVLVWPEQGLGDQIMFARFVTTLAARGCDVTLVCAPPLEQLFRASLPVRTIAAKGTIDFPEPDVWLWSNSLLAATAATAETLPQPPYLAAAARSSPYRIGVATRGDPKHPKDAHRSLTREAADILLGLPGTRSLLPEHTGAQDFAETAEIVAGLDLVIAVDTSIAHLAGALGRPVWILLPATEPDWRWMRERSDTPWYPTARLFRQDQPGDWSTVLHQVIREIGDTGLIPSP